MIPPRLFRRFTLLLPLLAALAGLGLPALPGRAETDGVAQIVAHARAHADGTAPASFRAADYQGDLHDLPIGVFDSGIGGLTVFEAIKTYDAHDNRTGAPGADGVPDFAGERFIYLGDQANMPYGNYTAVGRQDFLRELVLRDLLFLLGRRYVEPTPEGPRPRTDKLPVKAIVIACNTATAVGLADLRTALKAWNLPLQVIGVIEAGANATVDNGRTGGVAVFATVATCASEAYPRALAQAATERDRAARPVHQLGLPTLAAAIEGDASVRQTPAEIVQAEIGRFLAQCREQPAAKPIDTLVLGCTHYPLVKQDFARAFADAARDPATAALLAPTLAIVDPAETTAADLYRLLRDRNLRATEPRAGSDRFFLSVANPQAAGVPLDAEGGLTKAYKYSRDPGHPERDDTIVVPMTPSALPASGAALVREHLPATWAALQASARQ